ncbi:ras association domain-containing protein 1-like isoform X2 [Diadema antillarum]|uniref:ras association domain-containing protein 1-like isoform X2 n=1 Tax=Diadema antillarum TaxID=105358 RepID=UPI003A86E5E4
MSSDRQAADVTAAPQPAAAAARSVDSNDLPGSRRGAIGNIAAASSSYVVTSIGGMFNRVTEYFEMRPLSHSSSSQPIEGDESSDFDVDEFFDSVGDDLVPEMNGHTSTSAVQHHSPQRGIFAGISNYFHPWRKYQPVPTQDNDNNNRRRDSSSVDGVEHRESSSFPSFQHDHFSEPYPPINERINGEGVYVDDANADIGQGHKFVPTQLLNIMTWCDKCGELIWGFYKQCLRCTCSTCIMAEATKDAWLYWNPVWRDCKYTCHYKCVNDVGLDCTESPAFRDSSEESPEPSPQHTLVSVDDVEDEMESFVFLTREELEPKIEKFNTLPRAETLALNEEGTVFSGCITIHINLARPVSVRTGCPLPDICISTLKQYEHSIDTNKRRTTFFLPKATPQELNITCYTTAQDVIRNVLAQLQLIDNPRKFALFERTEHNGQVFMRKMVDEDKPLFLCLGWVKATGDKKFELRENETGVIEWEAFTVPELQNFLRILDKEEEEYIQQVRRRYIKYQSLLQEAMESAPGASPEKEAVRS